MKRAFRTKNFGQDSLDLIEVCDSIVEDYSAQGLRLTLRQLYYQLVTRNRIENVERSYKRLSSLVSDARLSGLLDWDAIEDRGRQPHSPSEFEDLGQLVDAAVRSYRLPRWKGQNTYVELWVEKDALAGVLEPLAREHHVTLMVNKGYSSQSAMYASAQRFLGSEGDRNRLLMQRCRERGTPTGFVFYLGDHDPSGEDMVRDVGSRLKMFGANVQVFKLALTMEQIEEYDPPPNPAKVTDPRAAKYMEEHGDSSWEVDALPPEVLSEIVRDAFERVIDKKVMAKVLKREKADKKRLKDALATLENE